jgi:hypothetical protein
MLVCFKELSPAVTGKPLGERAGIPVKLHPPSIRSLGRAGFARVSRYSGMIAGGKGAFADCRDVPSAPCRAVRPGLHCRIPTLAKAGRRAIEG